MSWLRSAVYKAVEVGGNNNLSRAVRSYADTVVNQAGQAVVGGARLFQDRGARNFQSYRLAVKRLEEVSVSCRGIERVQLLRRWLVALKEIDRLNEAVNSEHLDKFSEMEDAPSRPTVVMYYDPDLGGEPMNFRDVFLHSQALEGITLSLILEEPNQEELSLLLEIFRLCLMGGKEAHDVAVSSVQELAKAFSTYSEEVLAKREELLQYAQDAIAGLKVNAEIRIDSEVSNIRKKLMDMKNLVPLNEVGKKSSESASRISIETFSRLEELLHLKKLMKNGDSPAAHNHKVDKLKILSESLASSASKAEKRMTDNRIQKEEALKFRVTKSSEELTVEIKALERRKDELEEELKKVTTALTSSRARLHNAREERDQFDEASNQIIQHFKVKDDELSKSIASYRAEGTVCNTFVHFLENTWVFQSSCAKQKDKRVKTSWSLLFSIRKLVENLKRSDGTSTTEENDDAVSSRTALEEQYQAIANKVVTTFGVVESIKNQFSTQQVEDSRDTINGKDLRTPSLSPRKHQNPTLELDLASTSRNDASRGISLGFNPIIALPLVRSRSTKVLGTAQLEPLEVLGLDGKKSSDAEAQLSKLKMELELENHSRGNSMEGIIDWEFDEVIEKEPRKSV
ncbi:UNVERIFIED_CONTAM: hypothetical protein Scaly_1741700 [Sesamum calycinum]|uniref:Uncharacterized protein n=1 Tax=Sesamum calycinum TaxID=2727403 RepID=A0AAW2NUK0_9LAMI